MSLLGLNASNAILFYPHTLTVKNRSGSLPGWGGDGFLTCGRECLGLGDRKIVWQMVVISRLQFCL